MTDGSRREREVCDASALLEALPDASVIIAPGGQVLCANQKAALLLGYRHSELVGKAMRECGMGASSPRELGPASGASAQTREIVREDGSRLEVQVLTALLTRETSSPWLVTLRKPSQSGARSSRYEAATANARDVLARFAHELRSPLQAIMGFAQLLREKDARVGPAERDEFLGHLERGATHLSRLVEDILDLAKLKAGRFTFDSLPTPLGDVARDIEAAFRGTTEQKHIELVCDIEPELVVTLDAARVRQVLSNYISNVIKFTPRRGRLTVRMGREPGDFLRLEVEGSGLSEESAQRFAADFSQIAARAENAGGLGLELAVAKRLVEAQGGSAGVRAVSEPAPGCVFFARYPIVQTTEGAWSLATLFPVEPPTQRRRTLYSTIPDAVREDGLLVDCERRDAESLVGVPQSKKPSERTGERRKHKRLRST